MLELIIIFVLLICCSAFFSFSETALFSLSRVQLHRFRESKSPFATRVIDCLKTPRDTIVTILFGNELANVSISIVGAAIISRVVGCGVREQTIIAVAVLTPVIMLCGEILPKNLALSIAPQAAPVVAAPIHLFYHIITPFRRMLTWIANRVVRMLGGRPDSNGAMIMEEEFRRLVDLGMKKGVIEEEEREIIHNVFEFTDKRAGDIMTPAERLFALPLDMPYDKLLEEVKCTQFSRVPCYEGERDNLVGILHVRDLFSFEMRRKGKGDADIRSILIRPLFVNRGTPLEELLKDFQRTHLHMALVQDEAGSVAGVVTMDDVQEELFGEIEE